MLFTESRRYHLTPASHAPKSGAGIVDSYLSVVYAVSGGGR